MSGAQLERSAGFGRQARSGQPGSAGRIRKGLIQFGIVHRETQNAAIGFGGRFGEGGLVSGVK